MMLRPVFDLAGFIGDSLSFVLRAAGNVNGLWLGATVHLKCYECE
ncbi:MAG: hypothetical protein ACJA16_004050 [Akkermansiaceae bacterium]|jgi:hypothetical protein